MTKLLLLTCNVYKVACLIWSSLSFRKIFESLIYLCPAIAFKAQFAQLYSVDRRQLHTLSLPFTGVPYNSHPAW